MRKPETWSTAKGQVIPITEIGDQHLVNIIGMIEQNIKGEPTPSGMLDRDRVKQYNSLQREALRRGLFKWDAQRKYKSAIQTAIRSYRKPEKRASRSRPRGILGAMSPGQAALRGPSYPRLDRFSAPGAR